MNHSLFPKNRSNNWGLSPLEVRPIMDEAGRVIEFNKGKDMDSLESLKLETEDRIRYLPMSEYGVINLERYLCEWAESEKSFCPIESGVVVNPLLEKGVVEVLGRECLDLILEEVSKAHCERLDDLVEALIAGRNFVFERLGNEEGGKRVRNGELVVEVRNGGLGDESGGMLRGGGVAGSCGEVVCFLRGDGSDCGDLGREGVAFKLVKKIDLSF